MPDGYLTTHVLDTARGMPAGGMKVELFRIVDEARTLIATKLTNADGRTDGPILPADEFVTGTFELVFHAGAYFDRVGLTEDAPRFVNVVPVRFGISDKTSHYHVPLLVSPFSFSTYRGS